MRLFGRSTATEQQEAREVLASFGLTEQEAEQNPQEIPWHCAWCSPCVNSATSGICAECESKYFPRRHGGTR